MQLFIGKYTIEVTNNNISSANTFPSKQVETIWLFFSLSVTLYTIFIAFICVSDGFKNVIRFEIWQHFIDINELLRILLPISLNTLQNENADQKHLSSSNFRFSR